MIDTGALATHLGATWGRSDAPDHSVLPNPFVSLTIASGPSQHAWGAPRKYHAALIASATVAIVDSAEGGSLLLNQYEFVVVPDAGNTLTLRDALLAAVVARGFEAEADPDEDDRFTVTGPLWRVTGLIGVGTSIDEVDSANVIALSTGRVHTTVTVAIFARGDFSAAEKAIELQREIREFPGAQTITPCKNLDALSGAFWESRQQFDCTIESIDISYKIIPMVAGVKVAMDMGIDSVVVEVDLDF